MFRVLGNFDAKTQKREGKAKILQGALRLVACAVLVTVAAFSAPVAVADGSADTRPADADTPTTRIVSLVPNLTELAFAVGAGDQVVGVSDYCDYPAEARERPAVGGLVNPGLEATLRLRPTVVLLYRSQTDFAGRLDQLGVATEMFQVDTLADLETAIGRLGVITGKTTAAARLARKIDAGLAAVRQSADGTTTSSGVRSRRAGDGAVISGIVIVSRDPSGLGSLYQASPRHFLGQLFRVAGGRLALPAGATVSREDIIRANPDIIIDMSPSSSVDAGSADGGSAAAPRRGVGPWAALTTVAAVKNGQVYQWADPHATLLGPSVTDTARHMNRLIMGAETARIPE